MNNENLHHLTDDSFTMRNTRGKTTGRKSTNRAGGTAKTGKMPKKKGAFHLATLSSVEDSVTTMPVCPENHSMEQAKAKDAPELQQKLSTE